ncbi:MAG: GLPGLI family protein [Saprospiraceae bacterium]|jgi:GLPGLI family protein|nr:GLPGLI family protein [Candidatus Parvibacillus calidus]MBX2936134.1 GLPGLI family protein [Saprospiraceae bacterium]MCO5283370.1 GLPGLI family protein [Saprospiraceae bacterium]MCO6470077.1 GLPGLI family protein [Saprospiraceae bacterium]
MSHLINLPGIAQNTQVVTCGTIKFEKKVSIKKKLIASKDEEDDGSFWFENMIKNAPDYSSDQFILQFRQNESLYSYDKKLDDSNFMTWGGEIASKNIVYKDFNTSKMQSEKQFYDLNYVLKDSIKQFNWKLTREFRNIAGFECRRATTIINDSLYVIAFYTDDIQCSSGPESFSGLPGMILGVVMPRLYTTWFATSVDTYCNEKAVLNKPLKGKNSNEGDLIGKIKERYGKYKKWYQSLVWSLII